jgi:hypothetical protein
LPVFVHPLAERCTPNGWTCVGTVSSCHLQAIKLESTTHGAFSPHRFWHTRNNNWLRSCPQAWATANLERAMVDSLTARLVRLLSPLLAMSLLLAMTGCEATQDDHANASATSEQEATPDPVADAHKRGREWAQRTNAKLVTDCGALADADERFGCADYIHHPDN